MELSRKRRRELKRLKGSASDLWEDQRDVLDRASKVVAEARRQLVNVSREEVAPRMRDTFDNRVLPRVATGIATTKYVARSARDKITEGVLPTVSGALGSALTMSELAKDQGVREALDQIRKGALKRVSTPPKKSYGPGSFILMALGAATIAGIAYATWQTLRSDDDLWVGDEAEDFDELPTA
jgi:hypothetical protein